MAVFPGEVEGTIEEVPVGDGAGAAILKVNGVTVVFAPGTYTVPDSGQTRTKSLTTAAGPLTIDQLIDRAPLPGRNGIEGFHLGTAIAEGEYDTTSNQFNANRLTVEPAENVLVGVVTRNNPGTPRDIAVNGTKLRFLDDPRMMAAPPRNEFGFDVKIETITPEMPASAEGYYANGEFHAFVLEVDGNARLVNEDTPQVSITRAQARFRGAEYDLEVRGGLTTSHPGAVPAQRIDIYRIDEGFAEPERIGGDVIRVRAGNFGKWDFRARITIGTGRFRYPPEKIFARNSSLDDPATPDQHIDSPVSDIEIIE